MAKVVEHSKPLHSKPLPCPLSNLETPSLVTVDKRQGKRPSKLQPSVFGGRICRATAIDGLGQPCQPSGIVFAIPPDRRVQAPAHAQQEGTDVNMEMAAAVVTFR
jgi:hypothetical protein